MAELRGMCQDELAHLCKPKTQQAAITQFENASVRLTWERATQLAPGYFGELWSQDREAAIGCIWMLWFENAESYGNEAMKREAREIRAHIGTRWELPTKGLHSPITRECAAAVENLPALNEARREAM